ncbi:peptidyl-prolyl cis-trans isomerase [Pendulispora rubella]|uniref:Peptidyl-prolyl cis-trans isomerase n=1 Tax=Pendulispora rubella TaxID=2741070 RepID=A0ABZ2L0R9_9BACT
MRIILLTVVLAAAAACGHKARDVDAGDAAATPRSATSLTPEEAAQVLVKVGKKSITLGDFAATLEQMDQFDRLRYQSPERRKELLEEMIRVELLADEATAKGYDKDPAAAGERRAILREALTAQARQSGPTPNEVPEPEVRAYFDAHRGDYKDPERRRVSVIALRDEASARALLDAAKRATAAEWGELVRKKSIDPSAKANMPVDLAGDLGMVSPPGDPRGENARIPEEVRAALFAIGKVGEVHPKPVVVAGGKSYLVRLTQKADARERTYAEAERTIRIKLSQDKMRAKEDELLAALRTQYPVQIDEAALVNVGMDAAKRN